MARLNYLLFLFFIFEVHFYCTLAKSSTYEQYNENFCNTAQCSIDINFSKIAIMKSLQNIDECTNKRNDARE